MPHFRMRSSGKIFAEKVSMLYVMVNKWDLSCLSTKMGNENSRNDFKWQHLYILNAKVCFYNGFGHISSSKKHFWLFHCGTAVNYCKKRHCFSFYAQFAHMYICTCCIKTYTCNLWDCLYMVGAAFAKWITCIKLCLWLKCNINFKKHLNQH